MMKRPERVITLRAVRRKTELNRFIRGKHEYPK